MAAAFWLSAASLVYTYAGFPLIAFGRALLRPRPYAATSYAPRVSVVIAARNEARVIRAKIENLLRLDYPLDRLEILVASDGSDDGTDEIVRSYEDGVVQLIALPRVGKADALNAAVSAAHGDVLVFTDANSMLARDALTALVRPLSDPQVGGVAGDQRYQEAGAEEGTAEGERHYWSFDRLLKQAESRAGHVISATGALYAIRRSLFEPVVAGVTDDFYVSTGVIAQGRRLVFAADAVALEPVASSSDAELERKVRVMTRGLRGVMHRRELLNPRRYGFYAVQLLSHKVLRRLMGVPLLVIALTGPLRWRRGPLFRAATVAQGAFYAAALVGIRGRPRQIARTLPVRMAAYFSLVNYASLRAAWNILRGREVSRWEPRRGE